MDRLLELGNPASSGDAAAKGHQPTFSSSDRTLHQLHVYLHLLSQSYKKNGFINVSK